MTFTANQTDSWLPLMEYAVKTGTSLSTLRRYIKANKVAYRVESGKYYVRCAPIPTVNSESAAETQALRTQLKMAQEEIVELKTLIAFYENG